MSLVYYATVLSTKDPLALGRVQVKLKGYPTPLDLTDVWLRMLQPYAGNQYGTVFLPEIEDEVVILRTAGDALEGMLILGAVYNGKNKPNYSNADDKNITKEIRTKAGNVITFSDKENETGITLSCASTKVTMVMSDKSDGSITIDGAKLVTIKSTDEISLASAKVTIKATDTLTLGGDTKIAMAGGEVAVSGTKIGITSDGDVAVAGTAIKLG